MTDLAVNKLHLPSVETSQPIDYLIDSVPEQRPSLALVSSLPNYLGVTAIGNFVVNPKLHKQAGLLRARVYIDEKGFLDENVRNQDGTENDEDDARSVHLAVTSKIDGHAEAQTVGVTRLIRKSENDELLPAERLFGLDDAPIGSIEVSRFIARHPDKKTQHLASLALMRASFIEGLVEGAPYVYAVVEEPLFRKFDMIGLPFEPVTDLTWLEEYNSKNRAIRLDPQDVIPALQAKDASRPAEQAVAPFFEKEIPTYGRGYFGPTF